MWVLAREITISIASFAPVYYKINFREVNKLKPAVYGKINLKICVNGKERFALDNGFDLGSNFLIRYLKCYEFGDGNSIHNDSHRFR